MFVGPFGRVLVMCHVHVFHDIFLALVTKSCCSIMRTISEQHCCLCVVQMAYACVFQIFLMLWRVSVRSDQEFTLILAHTCTPSLGLATCYSSGTVAFSLTSRIIAHYSLQIWRKLVENKYHRQVDVPGRHCLLGLASRFTKRIINICSACV